jgi:hypothetical protein
MVVLRMIRETEMKATRKRKPQASLSCVNTDKSPSTSQDAPFLVALTNRVEAIYASFVPGQFTLTLLIAAFKIRLP